MTKGDPYNYEEHIAEAKRRPIRRRLRACLPPAFLLIIASIATLAYLVTHCNP